MVQVSRRPTAEDALASLAGVGAVAGSYAAVGFTPAFVGSPLERWLSRNVPGAVITLAIQQLGSLGQKLNLVTATVLTALALALAVRLAVLLGDRTRNRAVPVVAGAALAWAITAVLTGALASATGAALGAAAVLVVAAVSGSSFDAGVAVDFVPDRERRRLLGALAATAGLGSYAYVTASGSETDPAESASIPEDASPVVRDSLRTAASQSLDVTGIEPLVSERFYQVDINAANPDVDPAEWSLSVTGAVESEATYSLSDLREMEAETAFNTLRCVGEPLNGKQLDNALWTGVPATALLERAGVTSECNCVRLEAADGYFQVFPLEALERGVFAYRMNGRDLPRGHGYPLRALVPGHWGEVQVKWLTGIELLNEDVEGYWEKRGWHGTGPVKTVAKLHAVNDLDGGRKQVAGHAYAGLRGVSAVEVSTDGGDTWQDARLSEPLSVEREADGEDAARTRVGDDVWRQWAYEYEPPGGRHEVIVRAVEGDGTVQPSEETDSFPSGASGWVSRTVG